MRYIRICFALFLLISMVGISGCDDVWSEDFTHVYDVNDWDIESFGGGPGGYDLYSAGLFMNYYRAIGPYGFNGDFTMTVEFSLDVDEVNPASQTLIALGDGTSYMTMQHIIVSFHNLGDIENESMDMLEVNGGDFHTITTRDSIPGLRRNGVNTYRLVKDGDIVKAYFNGTLLCDYLLQHYDLNYSYPILYAVQDGDPKMFFKSIKFSYAGTYMPRP